MERLTEMDELCRELSALHISIRLQPQAEAGKQTSERQEHKKGEAIPELIAIHRDELAKDAEIERLRLANTIYQQALKDFTSGAEGRGEAEKHSISSNERDVLKNEVGDGASTFTEDEIIRRTRAFYRLKRRRGGRKSRFVFKPSRYRTFERVDRDLEASSTSTSLKSADPCSRGPLPIPEPGCLPCWEAPILNYSRFEIILEVQKEFIAQDGSKDIAFRTDVMDNFVEHQLLLLYDEWIEACKDCSNSRH